MMKISRKTKTETNQPASQPASQPPLIELTISGWINK